MWANIDLQEELTIGKLRELVTTGEFSKFPDNTPIKMCIDLDMPNVDNPNERSCAPVLFIFGNKRSINFYNYI